MERRKRTRTVHSLSSEGFVGGLCGDVCCLGMHSRVGLGQGNCRRHLSWMKRKFMCPTSSMYEADLLDSNMGSIEERKSPDPESKMNHCKSLNTSHSCIIFTILFQISVKKNSENICISCFYGHVL